MYLILFLFVILLICYFIYRFCFPIKEGMRSKPIKNLNIVLLGDYVLHEPESQQYPSLKEMFTAKFPLANIKVITTECKTIEEYSKDIAKLSPAKYNNKNTYFFVSVGSNNIYDNLINCSKVFDVKPKTSDKPAQKLPCLTSQDIYKKWKSETDKLIKKLPESNIVIIGSYYPKKQDKLKRCNETLESNNELENDIDTWNTEISEYCKMHKINYIPLDKYITKEDLENDGITMKAKSIKNLAKKLFHEIH